MTSSPRSLGPKLAPAWERLLDILRAQGSLLVAFSGGVDSTLLLAAAKEALGTKVEAALCVGAFTPSWDESLARRVAADLGVKLHELQGEELSDPNLAANPPQRCYFCKRARLERLIRLAGERGLAAVAEGSQIDDAREDRPGARAVAELGIASPLAQAGLGKAMVRSLSRALRLPTAQAPSSACLATRIPFGVPLSAEALARVDRAESALRSILHGQIRVRDHFPLARLELEPDLIPLAAESGLRQVIYAALKSAGYSQISLDLKGYGVPETDRPEDN